MTDYYYDLKMAKINKTPPEQPKREDRVFLRHAEKPPLKPTPENDGVHLKVFPINEVAPRAEIKDLNFKSLQIWLDHLGQAIYNPLTASYTENGEIQLSRAGDHRSRCLWEIGEPEIRLVVRSPNNKNWGSWISIF